MSTKLFKKSFSVIYEGASEGGYAAFVLSLPGCHTQGDTIAIINL